MRSWMLLMSLVFILITEGFGTNNAASGWKAGVAKVKITPTFSMWLAGYGARKAPSHGTLHDLWAKALAVEDQNGKRGVLITSDLVGVPKKISDDVRDLLHKKLGLDRSQIILNTSHTHTGPVLNDALLDIYPLNEVELEKIDRYSQILIDHLVQVVEDAFSTLQPAQIYSANGVARFQVNRRNNTEATLIQQHELQGPNDHAVPVLKVAKSDGSLLAVAFGYACHPTVLGINQWSGDYPGFAQIELEKAHPGTMALFFQGAGADQNPLPRRTVPLARQYGRTLAAAVDRVLEEEMQELQPVLSTAYKEVALDLNQPPTVQELEKHCESSIEYHARWAKRLLAETKNGDVFPDQYPYPLQVWRMGRQAIFTLGGELVVGYAIRLKEIFGRDAFVMGYTNDVMSYIPTATILHEGGYEGASSQIVYGLHGTWSYDIETTIIENMVGLARDLGVIVPENKLIRH